MPENWKKVPWASFFTFPWCYPMSNHSETENYNENHCYYNHRSCQDEFVIIPISWPFFVSSFGSCSSCSPWASVISLICSYFSIDLYLTLQENPVLLAAHWEASAGGSWRPTHCHCFCLRMPCWLKSSVLVLFFRPSNTFMNNPAINSSSSWCVFVRHSASQCSLTVLLKVSTLFLNWQRQQDKWLGKIIFSKSKVILRMLSIVVTCVFIPMCEYFNAKNLKRCESSTIVRGLWSRISYSAKWYGFRVSSSMFEIEFPWKFKMALEKLPQMTRLWLLSFDKLQVQRLNCDFSQGWLLSRTDSGWKSVTPGCFGGAIVCCSSVGYSTSKAGYGVVVSSRSKAWSCSGAETVTSLWSGHCTTTSLGGSGGWAKVFCWVDNGSYFVRGPVRTSCWIEGLTLEDHLRPPCQSLGDSGVNKTPRSTSLTLTLDNTICWASSESKSETVTSWCTYWWLS